MVDCSVKDSNASLGENSCCDRKVVHTLRLSTGRKVKVCRKHYDQLKHLSFRPKEVRNGRSYRGM